MRLLHQISNYALRKRSVYSLGLALFFWVIYDGIISYMTPTLITDLGYSNTVMGLIYGSSSIFGAFFDFALTSLCKKVNHRRMLMSMLIISLFYPIFLWSSKTIPFLVFCMAVWALYYDLYTFGIGDFNGRSGDYSTNSENVSILSVFKAVGAMIAPIIAGLLTASFISPKYYALFFVFISILLYVVFLNISKDDDNIAPEDDFEKNSHSFKEELKIWLKVGKNLSPVLLFVIAIYVFDSIIWTIGPLLSESFPEFKNFGGLYVALSVVPGLIVGFITPKMVNFIGKKKTAFLCFGLSNLLLIPIAFCKDPLVVLALNAVSSFIGCISYPAIFSAFADYVAESKTYDAEILGLNDFSINLGYIIGPILIGFLSDKLGNLQSISFMAGLGFITSIILILITPKHIVVEE